MKVLITCPPMLRNIERVRHRFDEKGVSIETPNVVQTLTVSELKVLVPQFDGWIIGDDLATREVFEAGRRGKLRAAVKWGVGVDNVDFGAAREFGISVGNTPNMFGAEVADIAVSYIVALARDTFVIDRKIRAGEWPKPVGISLAGKTVALLGFGDIGKNIAKRLLAADMKVVVYDPLFEMKPGLEAVQLSEWPLRLEEAHFLVLACALTPQNKHIVNREMLARARRGLRIVNVARGPLIDEAALIDALRAGQVHSAALDVFETEPLPIDSPLRSFEQCIFGSHNSSNTIEAATRASNRAIDLLFQLLNI